jgi:hypothetical protein
LDANIAQIDRQTSTAGIEFMEPALDALALAPEMLVPCCVQSLK